MTGCNSNGITYGVVRGWRVIDEADFSLDVADFEADCDVGTAAGAGVLRTDCEYREGVLLELRLRLVDGLFDRDPHTVCCWGGA